MVPPYAWLRLLNDQRLLVVSVVLSLALATANCHENQGHPRLRPFAFLPVFQRLVVLAYQRTTAQLNFCSLSKSQHSLPLAVHFTATPNRLEQVGVQGNPEMKSGFSCNQ